MPPTPNTVAHLILSLYLCSEIARWGEVKYDNYVILTANKWKLTRVPTFPWNFNPIIKNMT